MGSDVPAVRDFVAGPCGTLFANRCSLPSAYHRHRRVLYRGRGVRIIVVPAVANKLTINYRLRGLLSNWMDWEAVRRAENVFGSEASSIHLGVLMLMTVTLLGLAIAKVMYSQFPTQQEG